MSRLARGQQALIARQQVGAVTGNTITYTRKGGAGTVDLTSKAWTGRTVFRRNQMSDLGAAAVVFGDRDYLIPVADLTVSGTTFEPIRGDRITETIGGTATVFEVISPVGEPEVRFSDPGRTVYRVHTKKVG